MNQDQIVTCQGKKVIYRKADSTMYRILGGSSQYYLICLSQQSFEAITSFNFVSQCPSIWFLFVSEAAFVFHSLRDDRLPILLFRSPAPTLLAPA